MNWITIFALSSCPLLTVFHTQHQQNTVVYAGSSEKSTKCLSDFISLLCLCVGLCPYPRHKTTPVKVETPVQNIKGNVFSNALRLHPFNFTFMWPCIMWPCIVTNFFVIKPTRCTNFTNLFLHENLHVSDTSYVHHQEFIHSTLSNGTRICHTGL